MLNKIINHPKFKTIFLLACTSLIFFLVQTFFYPDAGQKKDSKAYIYSFQLDMWGEKIYDRFNHIRDLKVLHRLSLTTGRKKIDSRFLNALGQYHYEMQQLLRVLKFQAKVAANILDDISFLSSKSLEKIPKKEAEKILIDLGNFQKLLAEYNRKSARIESFLPELIGAFNPSNQSLTNENKIDVTIKQIKLLRELFSSDDLFLKHNSDHFKYVRSLAESSTIMLGHYEILLKEYNRAVEFESAVKNTILLLLMLIAFWLTMRKELDV